MGIVSGQPAAVEFGAAPAGGRDGGLDPACVVSLMRDYQDPQCVETVERVEWHPASPYSTSPTATHDSEGFLNDASLDSMNGVDKYLEENDIDEYLDVYMGYSMGTPVVDALAVNASSASVSAVFLVLKSFPDADGAASQHAVTDAPRRVTFAVHVDEAGYDASSPQFRFDADALYSAYVSGTPAPADDTPVPEHAVPISLGSHLQEDFPCFVSVALPARPLRSCLASGASGGKNC